MYTYFVINLNSNTYFQEGKQLHGLFVLKIVNYNDISNNKDVQNNNNIQNNSAEIITFASYYDIDQNYNNKKWH